MSRLWLFLLASCSAGATPSLSLSPASTSLPAVTSPAAALPPSTSAPVSAPSSSPASLPVSALSGRTVIARFVKGSPDFFACGVMAFVGVYVYELESTDTKEPLSGQIVVDVLCPDFYVPFYKLKLSPGERHKLSLGPAKRAYAGSIAPASLEPSLPRFEAKKMEAP